MIEKTRAKTRRRGRPVGETPAKTLAERSAAMRAKAASLCDDPSADLSEVRDSLLLWAFEKSYRARQVDCAARMAAEMLQRLGVAATPASASQAVKVKASTAVGSQVKGYPPAVQARAVAMRASGATIPSIVAMIEQECGHAPGKANLSKHLPRWAASIAKDNSEH